MIGACLAKAARCRSGSTIIRCTLSGLRGVAADCFDNHRPERNIRHETAVHDINVDPVGAGRIDGTDLVGEMCEVRR